MRDRCEDEIPLRRTIRQRAGRPKKAAAPEPLHILRVTRLMALAVKFQDMVDRGEVRDYADLARLGSVTRARMTQIMNLLNLAPDIQHDLLRGRDFQESDQIQESKLRRLAALVYWPEQRQLWKTKFATGQFPPQEM